MSKLQESGSATQTERRRSTRYPFGAVLKMEWGSAVIRGSVIDISAEGMRIEIADPLWVGARFSAVLALEPPLRMECVVRRGEWGFLWSRRKPRTVSGLRHSSTRWERNDALPGLRSRALG